MFLVKKQLFLIAIWLSFFFFYYIQEGRMLKAGTKRYASVAQHIKVRADCVSEAK